MEKTRAESGGLAAIVRVGLVALLVWWTLRLVAGASDWCVLDLVNLAFHEAGHLFMRPFGSTPHLLGGTLFQLAVPALLVGYFMLQRHDAFAAATCSWWLGESLNNVAIYMADARDLALPLIGGEHDWNELFFRFGALDEASVTSISSITRGLGALVMVVGLLWLGFLLLPAWLRDALADRMHRGTRST
jgi:hypothetical protein